MEFQNRCAFFTFFLFLLALFKVVKRSRSKNPTTNFPPGPWKLPIIGNLLQFLCSKLLHHSLGNMATKYGPLMHLKLGVVSYIIVSSPEIAREVLKTNDLNFSNRPHVIVAKLAYNATNIAFSPHGGYWRQLRRICTVELLSAKRVQSFRSIREEEVSSLIETMSLNEGSIVNLSDMIFSLTYGITARAAIGKKTRHQEELISVMKEAIQLAGEMCVADLYPSIGMLQMMSVVKARFLKLRVKIDGILSNIIDEHKYMCGLDQEDLVDVLVNFQRQKDLEYPLTDDNVKAVVLDVFSAGSETSSAVVEWAMSEMVKNPNVMEKAQSEVRRVCDNKGNVEETDIHQLKYLKSIIKETMRLHPPAPLLLPRESIERCEISGYEIPPKTRVLINYWAIGRDSNYWTQPEEFKPERFLDHCSNIDYKGTNFEFIPFGSGRRMCPGIAFAIADIELPLAQLIYHFDWRLPNGMKHEELDMVESYGLTARRENALCLIPIRRYP